jgi:hypothetical protein
LLLSIEQVRDAADNAAAHVGIEMHSLQESAAFHLDGHRIAVAPFQE